VPDATVTYRIGHRPVAAGEELCIYYGPDEKLWCVNTCY